MKKQLAFAFLLSAAAVIANGAEFVTVTVDTHTLNATTGSIDFQFNPSPSGSQAATVQIGNFSGATYLNGTQFDQGAVTGGPLPSSISITNSSTGVGINEDFEDIKFGNSLKFLLSFSGPAVTSPNGSSFASEFFLSMFSDAAGTIPVLTTNPNGILATVSINPDTGLLSTNAVSSAVSFAPEPGSLTLLGGGLLAVAAWARRRHRPFNS
jgi:PEP-CTERM motif